MGGQHVNEEIASQPDCWRRAADLAQERSAALPRRGERVAVVGCGTSLFIAQAYAALRESAGYGLTDAFPASEYPASRVYDRVVAITRSGSTTEVLDLLDDTTPTPTLAITADRSTPVTAHADEVIDLTFADEQSVVQTRFATSVLALLRASLDHDVSAVAADGGRALAQPLMPAWTEATQVTFLGHGWTVGLAHEAALKMRESAGAWTESYPAMEYRHGPISVAEAGRIIWMFGPAPPRLAEQISATGADFVATDDLDPMAWLVVAQRVAVDRALRLGFDPDSPRHLSRAVVLDAR